MKKTDRSLKSMLSYGAAALLAVGAASAQVAFAATGSDAAFPGAKMIDNSGSYQSEVQSCMTGKTQQDRDTCLKEARNAHADKQRGVLNHYGEHDQNAMARCDVFKDGEDKAACEARVLGYGSVDGSVAGGGLIRESETVVLPEGQHSVTIDPQTSNPIVLVPSK
jgi:hypothetical protein